MCKGRAHGSVAQIQLGPAPTSTTATQRNAAQRSASFLLGRPIGFGPFFPCFLTPIRHVRGVARGCAVSSGRAESVAPVGRVPRAWAIRA
eukprot:scaffold145248_cov127-Phaeocystis_antarctica.AAC.1